MAIAGLGTSNLFAKSNTSESDLRLALIGAGGRGNNLANFVLNTNGARLVAFCDADQKHLEQSANNFEEKSGQKVERYIDYRKLLERDDIDGVLIATPNHWHALMTIHACQAGKHVYVEKPVCHTMWEGRRMTEAATKYNRVVAAGFQNRSMHGIRDALSLVRNGELGPIKQVRGLCYRDRKSIGIRQTPLSSPKSVDYDLWLGPAADLPIMRNSFHYDWHWVFNTGNGDMGNQGPHELDIIRMVLGDPKHPTKITSFGGRFGWNDAGNTPNMQCALFDFGNNIPVIFEVRNLYQKDQPELGCYQPGPKVGIIVTCENGEYRGGRGGGAFYDPNGEIIRKFEGEPDELCMQNFIDAVHSSDQTAVNSSVESAYYSACLSHLANIAIHCGNDVSETELSENLVQHGEGGKLGSECMQRFSDQLKLWKVDTNRTPWKYGTQSFDASLETFLGNQDVSKANSLIRRKDRAPFVVPEIV